MSADNWASCPRCLHREQVRITALHAQAEAAYGSLPLAEFEALRAEAAKPLDPEQFRTFREDYEFYGAEEGTVVATYGGECTKCNLSLSFAVSRDIPGVSE